MSGMKFTAVPKVTIEKAFNKALFAAQEQILTDCNYFVKVDQGMLRDTSYTELDGLKLRAIWPAIYAKRQYYTGTASKKQNPNADIQWAEKAKGRWKDDWAKILEKGMGNAL